MRTPAAAGRGSRPQERLASALRRVLARVPAPGAPQAGWLDDLYAACDAHPGVPLPDDLWAELLARGARGREVDLIAFTGAVYALLHKEDSSDSPRWRQLATPAALPFVLAAVSRYGTPPTAALFLIGTLSKHPAGRALLAPALDGMARALVGAAVASTRQARTWAVRRAERGHGRNSTGCSLFDANVRGSMALSMLGHLMGCFAESGERGGAERCARVAALCARSEGLLDAAAYMLDVMCQHRPPPGGGNAANVVAGGVMDFLRGFMSSDDSAKYAALPQSRTLVRSLADAMLLTADSSGLLPEPCHSLFNYAGYVMVPPSMVGEIKRKLAPALVRALCSAVEDVRSGSQAGVVSATMYRQSLAPDAVGALLAQRGLAAALVNGMRLPAGDDLVELARAVAVAGYCAEAAQDWAVPSLEATLAALVSADTSVRAALAHVVGACVRVCDPSDALTDDELCAEDCCGCIALLGSIATHADGGHAAALLATPGLLDSVGRLLAQGAEAALALDSGHRGLHMCALVRVSHLAAFASLLLRAGGTRAAGSEQQRRAAALRELLRRYAASDFVRAPWRLAFDDEGDDDDEGAPGRPSSQHLACAAKVRQLVADLEPACATGGGAAAAAASRQAPASQQTPQDQAPPPAQHSAPQPPSGALAAATQPAASSAGPPAAGACSRCGAPPPAGAKHHVCGGCKSRSYCGPACSAAAWAEGHRRECKQLAAARAARKAAERG